MAAGTAEAALMAWHTTRQAVSDAQAALYAAIRAEVHAALRHHATIHTGALATVERREWIDACETRCDAQAALYTAIRAEVLAAAEYRAEQDDTDQ